MKFSGVYLIGCIWLGSILFRMAFHQQWFHDPPVTRIFFLWFGFVLGVCFGAVGVIHLGWRFERRR